MNGDGGHCEFQKELGLLTEPLYLYMHGLNQPLINKKKMCPPHPLSPILVQKETSRKEGPCKPMSKLILQTCALFDFGVPHGCAKGLPLALSSGINAG